MSSTKTSKIAGLIGTLFLIGVAVTAGWVLLNRQYVLDQLTIWSYTPSQEIAAINETVQFTEKGKFAFYATKPEISAPEDFNQQCPRQEVGSPILGCYTTDDRIYIFDLENKQLDGMEEVTAAHEMLHAVWVRTSDEDKQRLTTEIKRVYDGLKNDELKERMEYYERTEPGEFANELHSILATEIKDVGPELESYYGQYFDRSSVLALHEQYSKVYKKLYARADVVYKAMEALSASIEAKSDSYNTKSAALSRDIEAFNARANSGSFSSVSQFNAERDQLVARRNQLESERASINNNIARYDALYKEYQDIGEQIELLNDSVDSYKKIESSPLV